MTGIVDLDHTLAEVNTATVHRDVISIQVTVHHRNFAMVTVCLCVVSKEASGGASNQG